MTLPISESFAYKVGPARLHYDLIQIYTEHEITLDLISQEIEHKLMFANLSRFNRAHAVYQIGQELGISLECITNNSFIITLTV